LKRRLPFDMSRLYPKTPILKPCKSKVKKST
jgi:hypothetical protein